MRRVEDLSVRIKVLSGFVLVLALFVGLGATSYLKMAELDASVRRMSDGHLQSTGMLAELRAVGLRRRAGLRELLHARTEQERQAEHANGLDDDAAAFDRTLAQRAAVVADDEERRMYDAIAAANQAFLKAAAAALGFSRDGQQAKAFEVWQDARIPAEALDAAIGKDEAFNVAGGRQGVIAAHATYVSGVTAIVALLAGGSLIAVLAAVTLIRTVAAPIVQIAAAMRRLAGGDASAAVPCAGRGDEVGAMAGALQVFKDAAARARLLEAEHEAARTLKRAADERTLQAAAQAAADAARVVASVGAALARLAAGDLTCRLDESLPAAYETLRADLNSAAAQLDEALEGIVGASAAISSGTSQIAKASDDLSRRAEQQAASLEQTAAALSEITGAVSQAAEAARRARDVVNRTKQDAERSGGVVQQAVTAMSGIETSSRQISQIIGVIDEIAFQTNLLALNAGVEAARAGDAGRGFAVVASEVRALAQRSADAAKEIKALILTSVKQVDAGVGLVGETGAALSRILGQVAEIDAAVASIAASAVAQASGLAEVSTAVNQMDQVTQQNAAMVEQSTAAARALADETRELVRLTSRFRLGGDAGRASPDRPRPAARRRPPPAAREPDPRKPVLVASQDGWSEF